MTNAFIIPSEKSANQYKVSDSLMCLQNGNNTARGETALWVAVITQAMMDAQSRCKKAESIYHKYEAICWLTSNSKDFVDVCLCAGMDPDYVRRKAKKIIANPVAWRAEAGTGKRYEERRKYRAKQQQFEREKAKKSVKICETQGDVIQFSVAIGK